MRSRLRHGGTAEGPGHRTGPFALEQAARIARTSSFWKKAVLLLNYACEASPTVATDRARRPNAPRRVSGPVTHPAGEGRRPGAELGDAPVHERQGVEPALHAVRHPPHVRRAAEVGVYE